MSVEENLSEAKNFSKEIKSTDKSKMIHGAKILLTRKMSKKRKY